jgi:hypothetical protein
MNQTTSQHFEAQRQRLAADYRRAIAICEARMRTLENERTDDDV